jgi:hypothetical protein
MNNVHTEIQVTTHSAIAAQIRETEPIDTSLALVPHTNQSKRKIISVSRILLKRAKKVPYDPDEIR